MHACDQRLWSACAHACVCIVCSLTTPALPCLPLLLQQVGAVDPEYDESDE
jgi:hypothetical protein